MARDPQKRDEYQSEGQTQFRMPPPDGKNTISSREFLAGVAMHALIVKGSTISSVPMAAKALADEMLKALEA